MSRIQFVIVVLWALPLQAQQRLWTDSEDKQQISASLLESKGGSVYLRTNDGNTVIRSIAKLSDIDREYIARAVPKVQTIVGTVVAIADGDTLTVLDAVKKQTKIRLSGIDCPESGQSFGTKAKEVLAAKVFGKKVTIEWRETDRYKRTIGDVIIDGRWINQEMVEEGYAWHYKHFSDSAVLSDSETKARNEHLGLWQDKKPQPPWDYRHHATAARGPPSTPKVSSSTHAPEEKKNNGNTDNPTVYVTKTGKKYHQDGCRFLSKSKLPMALSDAAKQYGPCSVCRPPVP